LDWYPYPTSSPFTTKLVNHRTGQTYEINQKELIKNPNYFRDTVVKLAKFELDNYVFATNELSTFENIDE
jgi:hypothetical protein